jgi:hypothetical protein
MQASAVFLVQAQAIDRQAQVPLIIDNVSKGSQAVRQVN